MLSFVSCIFHLQFYFCFLAMTACVSDVVFFFLPLRLHTILLPFDCSPLHTQNFTCDFCCSISFGADFWIWSPKNEFTEHCVPAGCIRYLLKSPGRGDIDLDNCVCLIQVLKDGASAVRFTSPQPETSFNAFTLPSTYQCAITNYFCIANPHAHWLN